MKPDRRRVALVTSGLFLGGTTTFLCNFGGELRRRGIAVEIFSFEHPNPLASDFSRLNIPVLLQDERELIFEDRLAVILRELRRFQPNIVLANLSAPSFEVLRYMPKGVFRVGTAQSDDPNVYAKVRCYAGALDLIGAVSRTIEQTLKPMPEFAKVPVHYLPYGVPMPAKPKPSQNATHKNPLRILYLGRLDQEQKRVRMFPDILRGLQASDIPFHWTIAGDGPEREYLQSQLVSAKDHQTISFAGKVNYKDVPALLAEHDAFLLTSNYEGLPLSLLEAMGAGLVPVVTDLPSGIREVVDDKTGRLVGLDDFAGYARELVWLHKHPAEMQAMGHAAAERVRQEFSVEAMTDRWLNILPSGETPISTWPETWQITAPLPSRHKLWFSPPTRWLRRKLVRFRR